MSDIVLTFVIGFAAGAAVSACAFVFLFHRPLVRTARACLKIQSGDLSRTVPESGPASLRRIARTINEMSADFQEVLLLFAHMVRTAEKADPSGHTEEMSALIRDFKYFRVAIENGTIRDRGVPSPALLHDQPTETAVTAARAGV